MRTDGHKPATRRPAVVAWSLVLLAAGLEVVWALALTEARGLTRPGWALVGVVVAIISLVMLTLALRTLPLSSAYTAWVGIGAVGVALAGVVVLGEPITLLRACCLALIVAGVVGLTLTDAPRTSPQPQPQPQNPAGGSRAGHGHQQPGGRRWPG